jgi:hypothetical protein
MNAFDVRVRPKVNTAPPVKIDGESMSQHKVIAYTMGFLTGIRARRPLIFYNVIFFLH